MPNSLIFLTPTPTPTPTSLSAAHPPKAKHLLIPVSFAETGNKEDFSKIN